MIKSGTRALLIFTLSIILFASPLWAEQITNEGQHILKHRATRVLTDTTNFNNNLSIADDTIQDALDTLDNLTITGAPTNATYLTSTSNITLSAEVDLGALTTGFLYGTVAAGTSTISSVADVALTTNTSGNYVKDVADGTGIDGTAAAEGATYTPTLDLTEINSATFGSGTFTTLTFDAGATDPVLTMASNVFAVTTGNVGIGTTAPATLLDISGKFQVDSNGNLVKIDNVTYDWPVDDGTASQFLQTNGTGTLIWATSAGSGDITSVGDVASGLAFDGTQGTVLTFYNAGGNATITYDGTDFDITHTLTLSAGKTFGVGTTALNETTGATDSGAYLVGANDEFAFSASTNVQAVLNDLDAAIPDYYNFTLLPQGAVLDDGAPPAITVIESTGTNTPRFYVADFDATTDEIVYWTFIVPDDMASGNWLADVSWYSNDLGANETCVWGIALSATTEGDADTMAEQAAPTIDYASEDVNTTEVNRLIQTLITISDLDSVAAGDVVTLCFRRDADSTGGTDDLTSDSRLVSIRLRIPRS